MTKNAFWFIVSLGEVMVQIYFLSIVLNGVVGFLFVFGDSKEKISGETSSRFSHVGEGFRLILGIAAAIVGLLKLLYPMKVVILGDLFPALAGIIAGFILIFGFYREHSSKIADDGSFDGFGETMLHYKKVVGIVLLVSAVLHFLFPLALFL